MTYRMYLKGRRGRCHENFRTPDIKHNSVVHISISEVSESFLPLTDQTFTRFVGDATISVNNISPSDGRVDFVVTVDWNEPLWICIDITILEPPVQTITGI
jgi:hypothetical protein